MDDIKEELIKKLDEGILCGVTHPDGKDRKAADFIIQPTKELDIGIDMTVIIPLCNECLSALEVKNQALFYCIDCRRAQFISMRGAEGFVNQNLLFGKLCPYCKPQEPPYIDLVSQ